MTSSNSAPGSGARPMRVLHVSTSDGGGGAGRVAYDLAASQRSLGVESTLAVAHKIGDDPHVAAIVDPRRGSWYRWWRGVRERTTAFGTGPAGLRAGRIASQAIAAVADPRRTMSYLRGEEDFGFDSTGKLVSTFRPDIIHVHNLHGNYFDLRALPDLTASCPLVVSPHDSWLFTGHCAQSLGCDRWKTGCGNCPDLSLYPAVGRDATASNWRVKADIYGRSTLHFAAPSRWLLRRVQESMLWPAIIEARVVPYGIDLELFSPGDQQEARRALGLEIEGLMLLTIANGGRANPFKDIPTLESALAGLGAAAPVTAVILGDRGEDMVHGSVRIVRVPFMENPQAVAQYHRAADVHVHASRVETVGLAVIEALACGKPVIASAVGGTPEIFPALGYPGLDTERDGEAAGCLVAAGDVLQLRSAIELLLSDGNLRATLGRNALQLARAEYPAGLQASRYIDWYEEILTQSGGATAASSGTA